jgi:hypothetical protein
VVADWGDEKLLSNDSNFDLIFIPTCKRFQVSAQPLTQKAASLIGKETSTLRSISKSGSQFRLFNVLG